MRIVIETHAPLERKTKRVILRRPALVRCLLHLALLQPAFDGS